MKKSELKTGMKVQYRNGDIRVVLLNTPRGNVLTNGVHWNNLDKYTEDLDCILSYEDERAIDKVFESDSVTGYLNCSIAKDKLIWERTSVKDITAQEAFDVLKKHFGCEVKIKE